VSEHQGDQGRSETTPFGQGSSTGSSWGGQEAQQPSYGSGYGTGYDSTGYGSAGYGSAGYGSAGYGSGQQPAYGQNPYPQGSYPQNAYQPAGYGQPYGYGPAAPAKPGAVITSAVLGFVFGAIGVLASGGLLIFAAFAVGAGAGGLDDLDDVVPGLGGVVGAAIGVAVVLALLAVAWTVITIWGSVWALTGRSRVMLIVAGSISILTTGLGLVTNLASLGDGVGAPTGGQVVLSVLFFAASVAIVVLLCLQQSAQYFTAHRALRGR